MTLLKIKHISHVSLSSYRPHCLQYQECHKGETATVTQGPLLAPWQLLFTDRSSLE